jgi:hypothetical protein
MNEGNSDESKAAELEGLLGSGEALVPQAGGEFTGGRGIVDMSGVGTRSPYFVLRAAKVKIMTDWYNINISTT